MSYKWIGAILIVAGCVGTGLSTVVTHKREEGFLKQLQNLLEFMECELQYRLTPLPQLCRMCAKEVTGVLNTVLMNLSRELEWQAAADVTGCMAAALRRSSELSPRMRRLLMALGQTLGRFDLPGQLAGLESLKASCASELKRMQLRSETDVKSSRTVWFCAGIALVILFL